ncbi:hypothetical protein [Paludibacter jiangxiensis]|uniref:hypothetical protein n=1 Tax=Paludibacter jiangxiensis TaxID=681398 RepID=UPI00129A29AB|nr:hypothetical protein [Paludibacter jiangxiensis]
MTCVNITFNHHDLKGQTIYTKSDAFQALKNGALSNRKPLAYGYENNAFQTM